jgi:hypothetical protein
MLRSMGFATVAWFVHWEAASATTRAATPRNSSAAELTTRQVFNRCCSSGTYQSAVDPCYNQPLAAICELSRLPAARISLPGNWIIVF